MVQFNKDALDELKRCKNKIDKEVPEEVLNDLWLATSPKEWFSNFNTTWNTSELSESGLNRKELLELIHPHRNKRELDKFILRKLIVSVLAWGGLGTSPTNGKLAIETIKAYEGVCASLLNGLSSVEAYTRFYNLKKLKKMKGLRPAYFTKLIFFFGDQSGLIMDQWTARSTNLLLNKNEIKLERNMVSDNNSVQVYMKYLEFVSELKNKLDIQTPAKAEELIFSCPHKNHTVKKRLGNYHEACSALRKYVAENS